MSEALALLDWSTETPESKEWDTTEDEPTIWHSDQEGLKQTATKIELPHLEAEIEAAAQRILSLDDDWDGEGSPGYDEATLGRAIEFLRTQIRGMWEIYGVEVPVPQINPGPDGSIDIHWKRVSWELLVNIPKEEQPCATFYGDDYGTGTIKGSIDTTHPSLGLLTWLMK